MNPFLNPSGEVYREAPKRAYARFEMAEPMEANEQEERFVIYSAVSADWLDQQTGPYNLQQPDVLAEYWMEYWRALFSASRSGAARPEDRYSPIPIFQYELWINPKHNKEHYHYLQMMREEQWLLIEQSTSSNTEATVYSNLFAEAQRVRIRTRPVGDQTIRRALTAIFDPNSWPDATPEEIEKALKRTSQDQQAEYLAAYDVGQGSATGLLNASYLPFIYYDLGAPTTSNQRTAPASMKFCWTENPVIVLSHWDTDHWAGGLKDAEARTKTWIVPRQMMGANHLAFVNDILHTGGTILVWPGTPGYAANIALGPGQQLTVAQCSGSRNDRNGSGLAIRVDDHNHGDQKHWLATGDAGYNQVPFRFSGEVVGLVVPHHGARMSSNKRGLPARGASPYARLIYSFGPGNTYGHPRPESVDEHTANGWDIRGWRGLPTPGHIPPAGETRATAEHQTTHCGGVIVGWSHQPRFRGTRCLGQACSMTIDQG